VEAAEYAGACAVQLRGLITGVAYTLEVSVENEKALYDAVAVALQVDSCLI